MRIWFNRWFSVAYHYMHLIKHNEDQRPVTLYGTHPDRNHMSLQASDVADTEPELQGADYVDFCLDFCRRNRIDIFVPRLHMEDIVLHAEAFDAVGTKLLACRNNELLQSLMDKHRFYESVQQTGVVPLPAYHIARTAEQFRSAYEALTAQGLRVCFKPTRAEGGLGFRIIDNGRDALADLLGGPSRYVSFDEAYRILDRAGTFPDLMVMELLEETEYSIDCLADREGKLHAAVPRRKAGGRLRLLEAKPELLEIAERVAEAYAIPYNYNIQVKYSGGIPKLLEINPRMSGGLHISCMSGVNFPYLAVKAVLGEPLPALSPVYGILASHVEQPIVMNYSDLTE